MRLLALSLLLAAPPALAQPSPDDPSTWAQTERGVRLLGGSASIVGFDGTAQLSASPRVGLFVADGLALSADLQATARLGDGTTYLVGVGPTVTYYFGPTTGPRARPFVEAGGSLYYADFSGGSDVTAGLSGSAGLSFPLARNVAVRTQAFVALPDVENTDFVFYGVSAGFATFIF